jgi:hypothetical protein
MNRDAHPFGPYEDCPALDELIDLTSGAQGKAKQAEAEAHVAACAHCTTELALFREFDQPSMLDEEKPAVDAIVRKLRANSPVERRSWFATLLDIKWMTPALATCAMIAVATFLWAPWRSEFDKAPVVSEDGGTMRSGRLQAVAPVGSLNAVPDRLEWEKVNGAVLYRITVSEVDQTLVWSGTSTTSEIALPPEVRGKVLPRKTLTWQVAAVDAKQIVLATSATNRFTLMPAP